MKYHVKVSWDDTVEGYDSLPTEWEHECAEIHTCSVPEEVRSQIAIDYPGHVAVSLSISLI